MSMTLEEAIKNREECLRYLEDIGAKATPSCVEAVRWSVKALKALRPITREQVAEVWGSEGWETVPDKGFVDTAGRQVYHLHCPHCGFFWRETGHAKYFRFCPACGAPMTDKAVDMVMERLEALHSETKTD